MHKYLKTTLMVNIRINEIVYGWNYKENSVVWVNKNFYFVNNDVCLYMNVWYIYVVNYSLVYLRRCDGGKDHWQELWGEYWNKFYCHLSGDSGDIEEEAWSGQMGQRYTGLEWEKRTQINQNLLFMKTLYINLLLCMII